MLKQKLLTVSEKPHSNLMLSNALVKQETYEQKTIPTEQDQSKTRPSSNCQYLKLENTNKKCVK